MQVSVESGEGLLRKVHVQVAEAELQKEVDKRLNQLGQQAKIPGFRPGKVPRRVVVQRYGRQVRDEVVGQLLQSSFRDAIDGEKLRPAGSPRIDPLSAEPGEGLSYTAEFDVYPEVDLGDLSTLSVQRPVATIGDDDVTAMLDKLRRQRREFKTVERAATSGDRVRIDFDGSREGEPVEGASGKDFPVELGVGGMVPGFEEALEGISAGETRTFSVTFPDPYTAPQLAGKDVDFTVTAVAVEEGEMPELNDEFAVAFGVAEGGIGKLRSDVRGNMEREMHAALRRKTQDAVLEELYAHRPVDVPESLLEQEQASLDGQRRQEFESAGAPVPELDEEATAELRGQAHKRVSIGLLVAEIVKSGELKPDGARVRQHIDALASTYEEPEAVVRYFYSDAERLQGVESQILQDQAIDWVLERAQVVDETTSFEQLSAPA